jgi:type II restriction/modification system DNA methylase subunit YeeA
VVIGNPPFLGGSKKRRELGDAYFEALDTVFSGRVPGGADLVCYWFDKARKEIETNGLGAAGLVTTQSIRAGSNRKVLSAICNTTVIYDAWSDEPWVNDGAAVRVSLVCFGSGEGCLLNGQLVKKITAELSGRVSSDMTLARLLAKNAGVSFEGTKKYGDFDISGQTARAWLRQPNPPWAAELASREAVAQWAGYEPPPER